MVEIKLFEFEQMANIGSEAERVQTKNGAIIFYAFNYAVRKNE